MLIVLIFVSFLMVFSTVGSDICVPHPDSNINALLAGAINGGAITTAGDDPCLDPTIRAGPMGILCYFQTCEGVSPLEELFGAADIDSLGSSVAKASVSEFLDEVSGSLVCFILLIYLSFLSFLYYYHFFP